MIAQTVRKIRILSLAITVLGIAGGCSFSPVDVDNSREATRSAVENGHIGARAAAVAMHQLGVPYRYGGSDPSGFDCSGLVQYSYALAGKRVPRTTRQLWSSTDSVTPHQLKVGDLLFFQFDGKMSHVGLYLGERRFVHAPSSGRVVSVASLDTPYYEAALLRAGRP